MLLEEPKYEVLRGEVRNLKARHIYENFVFGTSDRNVAAGVSVAEAAAGLAGAVATAQMANYEGDQIYAFMMEVDGKVIAGRFWDIGFKEGDQVEVVGQQIGEVFEAMAVTDPKQRLIWITPHHEKGTRAFQQEERWRYIKYLIASAVGIFTGFPVISLFFEKTPDYLELFRDLFVLWMVAGVAAYFILRLPRCFRDYALETTAVGRALGIKNPEDMDIVQSDKKALSEGKKSRGMAYYY